MNTVDVIPNDLISLRAAADLLGCHLATIYRWILPRAGQPPRLRHWRRAGTRKFVSRAELLALFQPSSPGPAAQAVTEQEHDAWVDGVLRKHRLRK